MPVTGSVAHPPAPKAKEQMLFAKRGTDTHVVMEIPSVRVRSGRRRARRLQRRVVEHESRGRIARCNRDRDRNGNGVTDGATHREFDRDAYAVTYDERERHFDVVHVPGRVHLIGDAELRDATAR